MSAQMHYLIVPESKPPDKRRDSWKPLIELFTGLLAAAPLILGLSGQHPLLFRFGVVLSIFVLVWLAKGAIAVPVHWLKFKFGDKRFIGNQSGNLAELYRKLGKFISDSDSRGLMNIVKSAASNNVDQVERIIPSDYIGSWSECFELMLNSESQTLDEFLLRCRELTNIAARFNRDYVLRVQREFTKGAPVQIHYLDQLEEFRDEWNAYLRELESWATTINGYAQKRFGDQNAFSRIASTAYFERVSTFRRTTASSG
jgi:hypothetical protein